MGEDSLEPLLRDANYGVFMLCRTSNPGSKDLQVREKRECALEGAEPLARQTAFKTDVTILSARAPASSAA
jgi:orotidine-5'-phosphate decarboxylase